LSRDFLSVISSKDLGIALDEAKRMQISLPGLELAQQLTSQYPTWDMTKRGQQALMLALEHMAGINTGPNQNLHNRQNSRYL